MKILSVYSDKNRAFVITNQMTFELREYRGVIRVKRWPGVVQLFPRIGKEGSTTAYVTFCPSDYNDFPFILRLDNVNWQFPKIIKLDYVDQIMAVNFKDDKLAFVMTKSGVYHHIATKDGAEVTVQFITFEKVNLHYPLKSAFSWGEDIFFTVRGSDAIYKYVGHPRAPKVARVGGIEGGYVSDWYGNRAIIATYKTLYFLEKDDSKVKIIGRIRRENGIAWYDVVATKDFVAVTTMPPSKGHRRACNVKVFTWEGEEVDERMITTEKRVRSCKVGAVGDHIVVAMNFVDMKSSSDIALISI